MSVKSAPIKSNKRLPKKQNDLKKYDNWLSEHFEELVTKYAKKVIAVIDNEIVAVGENEKELDRNVRKKYPDTTPFIFTVRDLQNKIDCHFERSEKSG